jgi:hypothetical protein
MTNYKKGNVFVDFLKVKSVKMKNAKGELRPIFGSHTPRTSRFRCTRTRVRTSNLKWLHFAPVLLVN